jgi:polyhydroxybutyrate depolymerase
MRCCPLLLFTVVIGSCAARLPEAGTVPAGDYVGHLDSREEDLRRRSYRIHLPAGRAQPSPMVVVLHGAFSTARGIEKRSGFSRLADEEGFVVVYPNGYGFLGLLRHWNAGHCCGRARSIGLDDVAFLDAVLDDVARRVDIDQRRVYVIGESNGAMLAYLYAAARSQRIAAAAAVIGTIGSGPATAVERIPPPQAPVPMTIVHGRADGVIPFHGGPSERDPDVSWVSVSDSAAFWVEHNGTPRQPEVTVLFGGRVVRSAWQGNALAAVVLYEIKDWPHLWPGPESTAALAPDDPLRRFDSARVIWEQLRSQVGAREVP